MTARDLFSRIWNAYEQGELVAKCAWCGRIRIDETWLFPPFAALAAIDETNALSHSICDSCYKAVAPKPRSVLQEPS
jgi:hypothetical protein